MNIETDPLAEARADINVTPLIDVLLVLLVLFMIVTPVMTRTLRSDLPAPPLEAAPGSDDLQRQTVVFIVSDGSLYLNGVGMNALQVADHLGKMVAAEGKDVVVFVAAEDSVPYDSVIQLIDLCRGSGVEHVSPVLDDSDRFGPG